jgi:hypothetical protein
VTDSWRFGRSRVTVFPHNVEIDIEVAVAHPIAHVGDHPPGHFRMRGADPIADANWRQHALLSPACPRRARQAARPVLPAVRVDTPDPLDSYST